MSSVPRPCLPQLILPWLEPSIVYLFVEEVMLPFCYVTKLTMASTGPSSATSSPPDLQLLTRVVHDLQTAVAGVVSSLQHLTSSANPPLASPPRDPAQQCQPPSVTCCTSFLDQDTRVFAEDILIGSELIPREVAAAAVSGAYADLSCFAINASPVSDSEHLTLKDGQIIVSARNSSKQISCYNVWLIA